MQNDKLPEWFGIEIAQIIRESDGNHTLGAAALGGAIARVLLSRFTLCEKEPVAWLCRAVDRNVDATANPTVRDDYRRFKRTITNLYAPADIGKECGNG